MERYHVARVLDKYLSRSNHVRPHIQNKFLADSEVHFGRSRVFLGLVEAGLFPGIVYYLSLWYPRHMIAQRLAILVSAATLAGAFGGLLA